MSAYLCCIIDNVSKKSGRMIVKYVIRGMKIALKACISGIKYMFNAIGVKDKS